MLTHIIVICLHLHVDICLCCVLATNRFLIGLSYFCNLGGKNLVHHLNVKTIIDV